MSIVMEKCVSADELCSMLGVRRRDLSRWVKLGMPVMGKTKDRRYDVAVVESWLLANGHAAVEGEETQSPASNGKICRTYSELARELGMTCRNPERLICRWVTMPGFPGRAGGPGKPDGYLPVEEIRQWLENRDIGTDWGGNGNDEEYRKLDKERRRLLIEVEARKLQEQLGRLADVEEVARFNRQCVANAVAILEPLADDVLLALPSDMGPETRREVHAAVTRLLDNARLAIAEIIEGDKDETDEPEE